MNVKKKHCSLVFGDTHFRIETQQVLFRIVFATGVAGYEKCNCFFCFFFFGGDICGYHDYIMESLQAGCIVFFFTNDVKLKMGLRHQFDNLFELSKSFSSKISLSLSCANHSPQIFPLV